MRRGKAGGRGIRGGGGADGARGFRAGQGVFGMVEKHRLKEEDFGLRGSWYATGPDLGTQRYSIRH